ncbi:polysaccharide pyruvyl transferase family protein [Mesorhizobium microcysteis]|uniref:Polysaccharide pyruvyl transferase family protein n=2 Tax=Neoaquamicrobium microcysteis TaxID=2682781 RepID=A0A5D4GPI7_9HYPH|nr:polysaccharide pyruvyl transferase family protein [Mesorhizobium microcysteis]
MRLTYFQGHVPNFGDELNPYVFDRLLPEGFLDDNDDELLLGIGSIILDSMPREPLKHVVGSGHAYLDPPDVADGNWNIVFVRGPRTASNLGLPPSKAICDGAVLLRALDDLPSPDESDEIAFMPHYESLDRGFWQAACDLAGITMIDPRDDIESIISRIRGLRVLVTEAMHGAIVADAVRTPWVAVRNLNKHHRHKWDDWADALDIDLRRHPLGPSSTMELYVTLSGGRGQVNGRAGRWSRSRLARPLDKALLHNAARNLLRLAKCEPQLSDDVAIERATDRAVTAVSDFVSSRS